MAPFYMLIFIKCSLKLNYVVLAIVLLLSGVKVNWVIIKVHLNSEYVTNTIAKVTALF